MQLRYKAVDGQNLFDIVLNTYGAIEYIYKLIKDNNIENLNYKVKSGDVFVYDSDMVTDTTIFTNTTLSGVRFATAWEPLSVAAGGDELPDFNFDFNEDFGNDYDSPEI